VGLAELNRSYPAFTITPRPTLLGRISDAQDVEFDKLFKIKGEGPPVFGPELRVWLSANARSFSFEVGDRQLACQYQYGAQLLPNEIGVYLAALVGFADRLETPKT
jgi:hypothetical protein